MFDLLLAREEEQHVPRRLGVVNLHHRPDGRLQVVPLGFRCVEYLDRVCAARDVQEWCFIEVGLHLLRVHCRRHDHDLQVRPSPHDLLEKPEEDISGQGPFVRLIQDDDAVSREQRVGHGLAQKHTIRQELQNRLLGSLVLETDEIANVAGQSHIQLVRNSLGHAHSCHSSRLRAGNALVHTALDVVARLQKELRQLRRLARPGLADKHDSLVPLDQLEEVLPSLPSRQLLPSLQNVEVALRVRHAREGVVHGGAGALRRLDLLRWLGPMDKVVIEPLLPRRGGHAASASLAACPLRGGWGSRAARAPCEPEEA
mmetsp:Transcript_82697/g.246637  ORF Transcript_82697/g.246637 Transcript_82697/m.246637 type:complete len:314 (-) Transcript_82697:2-943(-)